MTKEQQLVSDVAQYIGTIVAFRNSGTNWCYGMLTGICPFCRQKFLSEGGRYFFSMKTDDGFEYLDDHDGYVNV